MPRWNFHISSPALECYVYIDIEQRFFGTVTFHVAACIYRCESAVGKKILRRTLASVSRKKRFHSKFVDIAVKYVRDRYVLLARALKYYSYI